MSLKEALVAYQQEKKEKEIAAKIKAMLDEQKRLLGKGLDINKDGDIIKVKKEWNENVLTEGGISYYKLNNKWYRVSVCDGDNDVILKFRFKDAVGRWVSVSAGSLKEAQQVIDSIYGTSKDGKHKYTLSACRV
jgi:hypothetical protein